MRDSDAGLMARAGAGDRAAWRALYLRHRDCVYALAVRFLGDEALARDVGQDVFVALFQHAHAYRPTATFTAYLRRLTVNRCINERASARYRTRANVKGAALEEVAAAAPGPEALLEREQTGAAVRAAIARLPARQRLAVVLSRFDELSYKDIAEALDCSVSSVESLLFRARKALAEALGDR